MVNAQEERVLIYWIWLSKLSKLTLKEKYLLLSRYTHPKAIFFAGSDGAKTVLGNKKLSYKDFDLTVCDADLEWLNYSEFHHIVEIGSSFYPQKLREIYDPPIVLYAKGDISCLNDIQISVVGSRKQTAFGRKMTSLLSGGLTKAGITISSGLALGVDATAHAECISIGGKTNAVLGCGIDQIYPLANRTLFPKIMENGCLVSEFALGTPPRSQNFPVRNRLISGLSYGVVVIEAARRSGSLITARLALDQGREVFAVPGSPFSSQSRGCNHLIKQGAKLVECLDDILEELVLDFRHAMEPRRDAENTASSLNVKEIDSSILNWISFDPISQDEIIQLSGLTSAEVSSMLLDMELVGAVSRDDNGFYSRL